MFTVIIYNGKECANSYLQSVIKMLIVAIDKKNEYPLITNE